MRPSATASSISRWFFSSRARRASGVMTAALDDASLRRGRPALPKPPREAGRWMPEEAPFGAEVWVLMLVSGCDDVIS
jgi:hypothetical protein